MVENVFAGTKLMKASHFVTERNGRYQNHEQVNTWIKNINVQDDEYALHRACSVFNPSIDTIYGIVKRQGLNSFCKENEIGIAPLKYLEESPFANIDQQKVMNRYILELMGETI